MRYRTKTEAVNTSMAGQRRYWKATTYKRSSPAPYQSVALPANELSDGTISRPIDNRFAANTSSIEDEVTAGRGIKNVTHTRVTAPVFDPGHHFAIRDMTATERKPFSWDFVYINRYSEISHYHNQCAFAAAVDVSWKRSINEQSDRITDYGIGVPPDRQAGLPPAVVKTLEGVHLTTSLLEARELPALFAMFGRRGPLASAISTLKNYNRRSQKQTIKGLINAYRGGQLGYSFGLMPTISDCRNIANELSRIRTRKKVFNVTLHGNQDRTGECAVPTNNDVIHINTRLYQHASCHRVDGVRVEMTRPLPLTQAFETIESLTQKFIGVNPMGLIWEVIPYSFAVDWFLAVDDVLDCIWCNNQTQYRLDYWTSIKSKYTREVASSYYVPGDVYESRSAYRTAAVPRMRQEWSRYERFRRDPPKPFDEVRARGANIKNVFLLALIALGFNRRIAGR